MSFLTPTSIAVIGASSEPGKVGYDVLKNILDGYKGKVFAVNPKHSEILGVKTHPSVKDLPETPDLGIIITPAKTVPGILRECAEKKIQHVVIISAGFKEVATDEGRALEKEITVIAKESGIRIIGPNCLGILRPSENLNASFAKALPPKGGIGLISQSGAFAVALLDSSTRLGLGYSAVLSIGNKAVLDECDFLEMLAGDPETKVIGLYLENIADGKRFRAIAEKVSQEKPIILIKAGTTDAGRKAASSHTGALAGSDAAINAACKQSGIHRAKTLEEFTDLLRVFSASPPLASPSIAIITNAGGPGILAADAAIEEHLILPSLSEERATELKSKLSPAASIRNPIDLVGDAGADRYLAAIDACARDPGIDGLVILLTPQVMTPTEEIAEGIVKAQSRFPMIPIVTGFMGEDSIGNALTILHEGHIPNFETPERAVHAIAMLKKKKLDASVAPASPRTPKNVVPLPGSGLLDEETTRTLLAAYDLPLPEQHIAKTEKEAVAAANEIGYPVVAKISSPEILHKTDVGGIRVNLLNDADVELAFTDITNAVKKNMPTASIRGILIQKSLPAGNEFIVGSVRDPSFGPLTMVGLGGIYTELFADTAFRLDPVTEKGAYEMLQELTSWKLLLGLRGKASSDIDRLARAIVSISTLMHDYPQIQELDLNPVIVREDGIVIADAKIVLS